MEGENTVGFVNPRVLKWARESTRLDLATAAKAAGLSKPERLSAAEEGVNPLTLRQLEALAKAYRLPLMIFYLPEPPNEDPLPVDFRTTDNARNYSSHLIRILREARERRDAVEVLLGDLDKTLPAFPAVRNDEDIIRILSPAFCVLLWREQLGIEPAQLDGAKALSITKELVEQRIPVLIFEYPADPAHLRGCSIYSEVLSIVVLSTRDNANARRFTLAHELAHLCMRQSGLCSPLSDVSEEIEKRCNWIAGESMLPAALVRRIAHNVPNTDRLIHTLVRQFAVSHSAAAVRLRQLDLIDSTELKSRLDVYRGSYEASRKQQKEHDGGPNYHLLQAMRLGPTFTNVVLSGLSSDLLSVTKAAALLGVGASYRAFDAIREKAAVVYGR